MFQLEPGKVHCFVAVARKRTLPIQVHGNATLPNKAAGDREGGCKLFEVFDGGGEIFQSAVKLGGDFFGGFAGEFFDLAGHFDGDVGDLGGLIGSELRNQIIEQAFQDEKPVTDKRVVGEFFQGAFLEQLIHFGIGDGIVVENSVAGFVFPFFRIRLLTGLGGVEASKDFFGHLAQDGGLPYRPLR